MASQTQITNAIQQLVPKQYITIRRTDTSGQYISHLVDYSTPGTYSITDLDKQSNQN